MNIIGAITRWTVSLRAASLRHLCLYAFAFGFAGALALPPTHFIPVLFVSFSALVLLLRAASTWLAAFAVGWSFAFGYFLLGLYWVAAALFVDISQFWWVLPFAVAGLPAVCALYYAAAAAFAKRLGLDGVAGVLAFALLWFLADEARGHWLTGFPWNFEGYVWSDFLPMMQVVSVVGIYGLTLLTLVAACLPAVLMERNHASHIVIGVGLAVALAMAMWGVLRLQEVGSVVSASRVRVVQPNIEQADKWNAFSRAAHFQSLLSLTAASAEKNPAAVIWPETASTFYLAEDTEHRRAIAASLPPGAVVLTGVIRRFIVDDKLHYANAMMAIDRSGRIAETYDKFHLVPFGEYIPFRRIFPGRTLANLGVDFTPGQGLRTLHLDGMPSFSPLICYEAIFPGEVARQDDRPQMLVNITNDGWYGRTAGPYQHFASARTRAIEEGLPMVRAANTGISGVIDPYGRIVAKIDLGQTGFVDADVPEALPPTIFSRYGDAMVWGLFAVVAGIGVCLRQRNVRA